MERRTNMVIRMFAIVLLLFVIIYYGYYLYVGSLWGFGDRMVMLLVSDGLFLLFIPAAIGLFMRKEWSWWLTNIIFLHLFIAKFIAIIANLFLLVSGAVAEPLDGLYFYTELFFLLLYVLVILFFASKKIRSNFTIGRSFTEWFWRVFLLAIALYIIHFILTVIAITTINPMS